MRFFSSKDVLVLLFQRDHVPSKQRIKLMVLKKQLLLRQSKWRYKRLPFGNSLFFLIYHIIFIFVKFDMRLIKHFFFLLWDFETCVPVCIYRLRQRPVLFTYLVMQMCSIQIHNTITKACFWKAIVTFISPFVLALHEVTDSCFIG